MEKPIGSDGTGATVDGGNLGSDPIDPGSIDAIAPDAEPPKRKRGRPAGSGKRAGSTGSAGTAKKGQKVALDLSAITGMFVGIHALLADRTGTPELAISPDEGKAFMDAAQNVMRHYSVETTQKTLDWMAFVGVASTMYAPRLVAINLRKRTSPVQYRKPAAQPGPARQTPPTSNGEFVTIAPDQFGTSGFTEPE